MGIKVVCLGYMYIGWMHFAVFALFAFPGPCRSLSQTSAAGFFFAFKDTPQSFEIQKDIQLPNKYTVVQ